MSTHSQIKTCWETVSCLVDFITGEKIFVWEYPVCCDIYCTTIKVYFIAIISERYNNELSSRLDYYCASYL